MLVINSNSKQGGRTTNDLLNFNKYPDFSQYLGFIQGGQSINSPGTYEPESLSSVLTVGGKAINNFFIPNDETKIFGTPAGTNIGSAGYIQTAGGGSSGNYFMRMRYGSTGQLKAGLTVGKYVFWSYGFYKNYGSGISISGSITFRPGLLHTDGTIDYISEAQNLIFTDATSAPGTYNVLNYTNSGIISQDGDRIIVEIYIPMVHSASGGRYIYMCLGYLGSATNPPLVGNVAPNPVQISIE